MKVSESVSCEKLSAQKMTFLSDGSLQSDQVVAIEMEKLKVCGLDAYDVKFFGRIDALSTLLKKMTKDKGLEFLTYGDLINNINHMKETENFQKIKSLTLLSQELGIRKASLKNWQNDIRLFDELGASEVVKDKVYKYLRNNPETSLTYEQLLQQLKK
ncbi:hypothetical protein [Nonlabens antarcticus]|uniref:hypothetical protein n=1 Tax=Nonlabens antarcticus TaxID=392714 RepID=UPI001890C95F|nr:hypothetical protein [Nonlabens antarcticus]